MKNDPLYEAQPLIRPKEKTFAMITFAVATGMVASLPIGDAALNFFKRADACTQTIEAASDIDLKQSWIRVPPESTPSYLQSFTLPLDCPTGRPSGHTPS